ncbi:MAG: RHS repeat-associated core domain-containing protein, partial [Nitrospirae bacterium]
MAPNSTLSFAYDGSLLQQTTWAGTVAGSVSRVYDTSFRISSQSVNGANTISFGYDIDSLLTSAGSLTITRSAQNGLISGTSLGAVTDTRTYSTFGELGQYTATANSATVLDVQYTRDKLGRITQKVETIGGVTDTFVYTYDTAGRLTDVNKNGATAAHYTYDSNGNRLSATDQTGTVNGTYDAQDRLTQYGNLQYTYTTNGELLTKNNPVLGQTASFTYDALGNLKSATLPGSILVEYVVDGQNRRIGKKINGVLVQGFLYQNQLNPVAELDGTGAVVSRFVYGSKANVPDYMIKAGVTYRIVSDHLGSPRLVIDTTTGAIVQRMDYDEFGNITVDTNPGFQPFGFAGGLYDQHTGLTRFGARDYDAQIGRWTAKDPIRFYARTANLYGYVFNDPVNLTDPEGKIIPLLLGAWAVIEFGLSVSDAVNTIQDLLNPCFTSVEKAVSVGLFFAGVVGPGGGYSTGAKAIGRSIDDILRADTRTFRRFLESEQGQAARSGGASRTIEETQRNLQGAEERSFRAPRGVETEWVGSPHINLHGPSGESIHFPV